MRKNKRWIQIIILSLLFVVGAYTMANGLFAEKDPIPQVGERAPNFSLTGLNGEVVSLSDYKGKIVMVNFWGTFCPPCVREMPLLQEYYETYADQGFVILGLNLDEPLVTVKSFVNEYKLTFPILLDKNVIRKKYGVIQYPTTFIVNPDGIIVQKIVRELTEQVLNKELQGMLTLKDLKE